MVIAGRRPKSQRALNPAKILGADAVTIGPHWPIKSRHSRNLLRSAGAMGMNSLPCHWVVNRDHWCPCFSNGDGVMFENARPHSDGNCNELCPALGRPSSMQHVLEYCSAPETTIAATRAACLRNCGIV
jgi:hypothetical protein